MSTNNRWPNRSWKTLSSVDPEPNSIINRSVDGKGFTTQNILNKITSGQPEPNENDFLIDTNMLALPRISEDIKSIQASSNILNTFVDFKPIKLRSLASVTIAIGNGDNPFICTAPNTNIDNNWTQRTLPNTSDLVLTDMDSSGSEAIVVGHKTTGGAYIARSTNGTTWTEIPPPIISGSTMYQITSCVYAQGVWLACGGRTGVNPFSCIIRSTDGGLTWSTVQHLLSGPALPNNLMIAVGGAKTPVTQGYNFLAFEQFNANTETRIFGSSDGGVWTELATVPRLHTSLISTVGFNIVHEESTNIWTLGNGYYSDDGGITFKQYPMDLSKFPVRTAHNGRHYLSISRSTQTIGKILYSLDGVMFYRFSSPILQLIPNYSYGEPFWHTTSSSWLLPINEIILTPNDLPGGAILQLSTRIAKSMEWEFVGDISQQLIEG